jgi:REP element-mobilizing transposase RayT
MSVRLKIPYNSGLFFITFTCARWLPLFEQTKSYDIVYNWFDYLKQQGHYINAYVIMPNHLHAIISFSKTDKPINKIIGDGKRFMSYEITKRLASLNQADSLNQLKRFVNTSDSNRNKKHEVFEPSFDWKYLYTDKFILQKLNYIHQNPCNSNHQLASNDVDYPYSSASNYAMSKNNKYEVTPILEMKDIDLSKTQSPLRETSARTT